MALTTRSTSPTSSGRPTRATGPASATARSAGSGERLTTTTSDAPAAASARATARPAPPAPTTAHRRPVDVDAVVDAQRVDQPGAVGVVAAQETAVARDAVHRAEGLGIGRQLVEAVEHRGLVRHRDRQPVEPERPHPAERQAGGALGHLEGEVGPVEPGGGERGVEDRRRQRVADRRADDAGRAGVPGDHAATRSPGRPRGTAPWRRGTRCCCR